MGIGQDCGKRKRIEPSRLMECVKYEIRDVVAAAQEEEKRGNTVIYLNIGDPTKFGFLPPEHIVRAEADAALSRQYCGYAPSPGDPDLRKVIARLEGCSPEEVFVSEGLSGGLEMALYSLLNPEDSVMFLTPIYPLYPTIVRMIGAKPIYCDCDENWYPDPREIERKIKPNTKAIVVINPNNPSGAVYPRETLEAIVGIAEKHGLVLIADEVYDHLTFEGAQMHKLKDIAKGRNVLVLSGNSISKNFFYPGARVGYVAVHNDDIGSILQAFMKWSSKNLSHNWVAQRGAIAAYEGGFGFLAPEIEKLIRRRDILYGQINKIPGLSAVKPQGALYLYVKVDGYVSDGRYDARPDWNLIYDLLKTEGILAVPGTAFCPNHPGEIYFRTTLLPDEATMGRVVEKLERFMRARLKV